MLHFRDLGKEPVVVHDVQVADDRGGEPAGAVEVDRDGVGQVGKPDVLVHRDEEESGDVDERARCGHDQVEEQDRVQRVLDLNAAVHPVQAQSQQAQADHLRRDDEQVDG